MIASPQKHHNSNYTQTTVWLTEVSRGVFHGTILVGGYQIMSRYTYMQATDITAKPKRVSKSVRLELHTHSRSTYISGLVPDEAVRQIVGILFTNVMTKLSKKVISAKPFVAKTFAVSAIADITNGVHKPSPNNSLSN
jgi:hypothetical protein